ncbi:MAG: PDDEXK nuclease domain-containing protein [Thermodesulfobacteriota bacterium]|nr:PDDEXK nuclease domain-containing protein [Thermodesulfobacteriota bacterium]
MRKKTGTQIIKAGNKVISGDLTTDIRRLIETARRNVALTVNASLTILYWQIGNRIRQDILKEKRADYGKKIVATLSQELTKEYGNGFNYTALTRMVRFAEIFPETQIVATLSQQLSWSHFKEILPLKKPFQRDFYTEMCQIERWSVRTLRKKIDGMLYERTAISKKPDKLIKKDLAALREEDKLTPDLVFRDPYFLNFLGLKDTYSEKDLEAAILREMESFILEIGIGFSFVARQKRITVDNEDYYLDLLFFHRKLKRLIAIELKLGKFKAAHKGQMELYLRWLEKYEKEPGEETPLGLILCAGKTSEQIELLQLNKSGIKVAEYMTELPKRELLERKLHKAVELARKRLEASV